MLPASSPTTDTALFTSSHTNTISTYPPSPPFQLAKLNMRSPSPVIKDAQVYSQDYAIFSGFLAVMICLAVATLLGVFAIWYVTRDRGEIDGVHEVAETDSEE
jgi:hypothetical protein